jgi:hypothetical protein
MRGSSLLVLAAATLAACTSGGPARSPTDARVRSYQGTVPPEVSPDARTLNAEPATLAALRGRVVYVQFAFPT